MHCFWTRRAACLNDLGYPELAAADAYKAHLLIAHALDWKSRLGGKVRFMYGLMMVVFNEVRCEELFQEIELIIGRCRMPINYLQQPTSNGRMSLFLSFGAQEQSSKPSSSAFQQIKHPVLGELYIGISKYFLVFSSKSDIPIFYGSPQYQRVFEYLVLFGL